MEPQEEASKGWVTKLRNKWVVLLVLGLALAGVFVVVWPAAESSRPGTVKIALYHPVGDRMVMLMVSNASAGPVMMWGPSQIERKEGGPIVVGGSQVGGTFLRGSAGGIGRGAPVHLLHIQLTGTNYGPWRVRVPISGYGALAKLESLLKKPPGWAARSSPTLRSFLQRFQRWSVSDWMDEPPRAIPGFFSGFMGPSVPQVRSDEMVFKDILRNFNTVYMRWPSNISELATFEKDFGGRTLPKRYEDAIFAMGSNNWVNVYYDHGRGYLSQPGIVLPSTPPFALRAASNILASRLDSSARMEDSRTFMFIVRNFQSEFRRWPTNFTELSAFAKTHRQPEIPERYQEAQFETEANGGIKITYTNGTMTLGGSAASAGPMNVPPRMPAGPFPPPQLIGPPAAK